MSTYLVPKSRSEHVHYWRGHQTSPTVVSLKGRLPQKLQSKSTLSCEIVHIRSLFRHGFINKPNYYKKTEIENRCVWFICDGFQTTAHLFALI